MLTLVLNKLALPSRRRWQRRSGKSIDFAPLIESTAKKAHDAKVAVFGGRGTKAEVMRRIRKFAAEEHPDLTTEQAVTEFVRAHPEAKEAYRSARDDPPPSPAERISRPGRRNGQT